MSNIMGEQVEDIKRVYDLKGSTYGRFSQEDPNGNLVVLKDLNFKAHKEEDQLRLSEERQRKLLKVLHEDVYFLKKHNLMDFSLLLVLMKSRGSPSK